MVYSVLCTQLFEIAFVDIIYKMYDRPLAQKKCILYY